MKRRAFLSTLSMAVLGLLGFTVDEWKDTSDINLSTSKTKQPLAVKEPSNRRFQFEQEER